MTEAWIEHDEVPEAQLPEHARDGKSGDRVSFVEGGLLHVVSGQGTYVRWSDVLAVVSHGARVYLLLPRRPPAPPWLVVHPGMLGSQEPDALRRFAERIREGGSSGGGGYRDGVRRHRQGLSRDALWRRVAAREPVPGMLEVPSTIVLGRSYPGLGAVQALTVFGGGFLGYAAVIGIAVATVAANPGTDPGPLVALSSYTLPIGGLIAGALGAREIGRRWRAAKDATLPRQRVLVLAPDGCIVGFREGVRTLAWSEVGGFGIERIEPEYDEGLVVYDASRRRLGEVDAGFLDAPLGLVVAIAQAYREAAE